MVQEVQRQIWRVKTFVWGQTNPTVPHLDAHDQKVLGLCPAIAIYSTLNFYVRKFLPGQACNPGA